jgi:fructosamine-3-kinase
LERINAPDLNQWQKQGRLNVPQIARELGVAVAKWQNIRPPGFGPFDPQAWRQGQQLHGYHSTYEAYFRMKLDQHLDFLHGRGFLTRAQCEDIEGIVEKHRGLLDLAGGCLVHKDLALWNVLGSEDTIAAFIDFDDAISGDPMDDLSLLACFHDAAFLKLAYEGYQSIRPLPADYRRRFWLHLLRNMIVKAVIRVGAGYFDRGDSFFLVGTGSSGADLKAFTHDRITLALHGLAGDADMDIL